MHDEYEPGEDADVGSPARHALALLVQHSRDGIVVDIGHNGKSLVSAAADRGIVYARVRSTPDALEQLSASALADRLRAVVGDQQVRGILLLDVIEQLAAPAAFLQVLRHALQSLGCADAPVAVSAPNVAHFDVAAKLLFGAWDTSAVQVPSEGDRAWFTSDRLTRVLHDAGFGEVGRSDFHRTASTNEPSGAMPTTNPATPLTMLLREVRSRADEFGWVYRFVRLYAAAGVHKPVAVEHQNRTAAPFLSVIMRTQGKRGQMLAEALLCLMAQTDEDLEVIICVHTDESAATASVQETVDRFPASFLERVRVVEVHGGSRSTPLNRGLEMAVGHYLAFLDDDDLLTADWIETFRLQSKVHPGQVLRSITGVQNITAAEHGAYRAVNAISLPFPDEYGAISHLRSNSTPICSIAIPMTTIRALRLRFDESLAVLEDWDFLLRASNWSGVSDTGRVTSIYHLWVDRHGSSAAEPDAIWTKCRDQVHGSLANKVVLIPRGAAPEIAESLPREESERIARELARLRGETASQYAQIIWLRKHGVRGVIRDLVHKLRGRRDDPEAAGSQVPFVRNGEDD